MTRTAPSWCRLADLEVRRGRSAGMRHSDEGAGGDRRASGQDGGSRRRAALARAPVARRVGPIEVLGHLADFELILAARLRAMLTLDEPALQPIDGARLAVRAGYPTGRLPAPSSGSSGAGARTSNCSTPARPTTSAGRASIRRAAGSRLPTSWRWSSRTTRITLGRYAAGSGCSRRIPMQRVRVLTSLLAMLVLTGAATSSAQQARRAITARRSRPRADGRRPAAARRTAGGSPTSSARSTPRRTSATPTSGW